MVGHQSGHQSGAGALEPGGGAGPDGGLGFDGQLEGGGDAPFAGGGDAAVDGGGELAVEGGGVAEAEGGGDTVLDGGGGDAREGGGGELAVEGGDGDVGPMAERRKALTCPKVGSLEPGTLWPLELLMRTVGLVKIAASACDNELSMILSLAPIKWSDRTPPNGAAPVMRFSRPV